MSVCRSRKKKRKRCIGEAEEKATRCSIPSERGIRRQRSWKNRKREQMSKRSPCPFALKKGRAPMRTRERATSPEGKRGMEAAKIDSQKADFERMKRESHAKSGEGHAALKQRGQRKITVPWERKTTLPYRGKGTGHDFYSRRETGFQTKKEKNNVQIMPYRLASGIETCARGKGGDDPT